MSADDLTNKSDIARRFESIQRVYEDREVDGEMTIHIDDLPATVRLGEKTLAIVNPAVDLAVSERDSDASGNSLGPNVSAMIIDPDTYNLDELKGFKALRSGASVTLGRAHADDLPRFDPFPKVVSNTHAEISRSADGQLITIKDLASKNGTYVGTLPQVSAAKAEAMIQAWSSEIDEETHEREPAPKLTASESSIASEKHPHRNEDSLLVDVKNGLFGVFDGVGGSEGGDIASATAKDFIEKRAALFGVNDAEGWTKHLKNMLNGASEAIIDAWSDPYSDAGTTAVIAKVHRMQGGLYVSVAHTGDSRAYLLRDGVLKMLTTDHTPFRTVKGKQEAMRQQERLAEVTNVSTLSPDDATGFASRRFIESYLGLDLGPGRGVLIDVDHFSVEHGDLLVLTSDGVHDNLTTTEMQDLLDTTNASDYAEVLTGAAYKRARGDVSHDRAKKDDITAVVVSI